MFMVVAAVLVAVGGGGRRVGRYHIKAKKNDFFWGGIMFFGKCTQLLHSAVEIILSLIQEEKKAIKKNARARVHPHKRTHAPRHRGRHHDDALRDPDGCNTPNLPAKR